MSGWGGGHGERLGKTGWQRQAENKRTMRRWRRVCHVCGRGGADRVDHVIPLSQGGTDDEANRRPIHEEPCHREKTERERAAGRAAKPQPSRLREPERHPGLIGPG